MSVDIPEWRIAAATHHPVRREILHTLSTKDPPVRVEPLASAFAGADDGTDSTVELLHHVHLPKLAEAGLVEYDQESNVVTAVFPEASVALDAYEQWEEAYRRASASEDGENGEEEMPAPRTAVDVEDPDQRTTVIVDIDLPAEQFVLGDVVSSDPGIQIELERIVPLDHAILPFLWVSDGSNEAIERLLRSSAYVTSVTRLVTLDDRALYQLEWTQDVNGVIGMLEAADGVIMEGHGTTDSWSLRLRFASHQQFKRFAEGCRTQGIDLVLRAVYNPHPPVEGENLTSPQREALRVAADQGYFKIPREVSLKELAEQLGVSEQAVSQRLRRGLDTLVAGSLEL
jgi:predicted DNA binding protein